MLGRPDRFETSTDNAGVERTAFGRPFVALGAAALAVALALSGCSTYPVNYKYRLTLEVEVDGEVRRGSSVVHVWLQDQPAFISPARLSRHGRGEATVVDLGGGRLLVALLTEREWKSRMWMPDAEQPPESRELNPTELPLLVTLEDASDPNTIREVDPENLAAAFGPDVRWHRIHVETTSDRLTDKVLKQLPWLPSRWNTMLDGRTNSTIEAENRLANDLHYGHFKRNDR